MSSARFGVMRVTWAWRSGAPRRFASAIRAAIHCRRSSSESAPTQSLIRWRVIGETIAERRGQAEPLPDAIELSHRRSGIVFTDLYVAPQFRPHDPRALHHRLHLAEGGFARQVFEAAVRGDDDVFGLAKGKRAADARRDGLRRLDLGRRQVEHAENDRLVRQLLQHGAVELRLRGLDRDLPAAAALQLRAGTNRRSDADG